MVLRWLVQTCSGLVYRVGVLLAGVYKKLGHYRTAVTRGAHAQHGRRSLQGSLPRTVVGAVISPQQLPLAQPAGLASAILHSRCSPRVAVIRPRPTVPNCVQLCRTAMYCAGQVVGLALRAALADN